jgi:hypothetical protein
MRRLYVGELSEKECCKRRTKHIALSKVKTPAGPVTVCKKDHGHPLKGPVNRKNHSIAKKFIFLTG